MPNAFPNLTPDVIAHHEAGHAVAAVLSGGHSLIGVTIVEGDDFHGRCEMEPFEKFLATQQSRSLPVSVLLSLRKLFREFFWERFMPNGVIDIGVALER